MAFACAQSPFGSEPNSLDLRFYHRQFVRSLHSDMVSFNSRDCWVPAAPPSPPEPSPEPALPVASGGARPGILAGGGGGGFFGGFTSKAAVSINTAKSEAAAATGGDGGGGGGIPGCRETFLEERQLDGPNVSTEGPGRMVRKPMSNGSSGGGSGIGIDGSRPCPSSSSSSVSGLSKAKSGRVRNGERNGSRGRLPPAQVPPAGGEAAVAGTSSAVALSSDADGMALEGVACARVAAAAAAAAGSTQAPPPGAPPPLIRRHPKRNKRRDGDGGSPSRPRAAQGVARRLSAQVMARLSRATGMGHAHGDLEA